MPSCEDCGGTGIDPGSLTEPEPCQACKGTGKHIPFVSVYYGMRKDVGREIFSQMQERKLRDGS